VGLTDSCGATKNVIILIFNYGVFNTIFQSKLNNYLSTIHVLARLSLGMIKGGPQDNFFVSYFFMLRNHKRMRELQDNTSIIKLL